jgi:hypothetical protein
LFFCKLQPKRLPQGDRDALVALRFLATGHRRHAKL